MPAVEFRVFDRDSGAQLTTLANAEGRQCQDVDNDTGTGGVTLDLADGDLAHMVEGNIVRCYVDGTIAYSWVVGPMDQSTVSPEEEAGEERRISGRGTLGLWADGIVYPETGGSGVTFPPLSERRVVDVRRFDFAAVGYDASGWANAVVVPPPPGLVPLDGTPSGWPLEAQDWIWSRALSGGDHPSGHSYFRHTFSVAGPTKASLYITADNGFEVFLDGELLLSEMRTPLLWAFSRSVQVQLTPGTHLIAIKAVNHPKDGPVNPAGVAMVLVALDTAGDPTSMITTTGAGWKCVDYPAEPPGMTVGRIITTLYNEAQARGALTGLTLGFSPTHDSDGTPWPNAPDVALPVGDDYLQVLRKLSELYCDVAMDPGSLRLDAWVSRGTNRSGSVAFSVGANITALSHKGGEQARTSAILGRFGDHWLERTGGGRRQEKFLEMGSATSSAQAQRMTDAALAERSLPIIATTAGWEPTAGTVPWVHFKVGDQVAAPNASGAMVAGRVKSISLTETEHDYEFVAEIGSMESEILDRLQRLARKTGHGALDGNFANATASTGTDGATDPTGGYLTSATPDVALNSLTDVASVWEEPPVAGDFLAWNPDLGMTGMWEPASVVQDVGTTVVPEQEFGLSPDPGISPFPASEAHTHGTPEPRHPQTGYPYVDFGTGSILLGCTDGEHSPAYLGTEDVGTYMRSFLTSPTGAQGWGRAAIDLHGTDDGTAVVKVYNDFANGQYGAGGTPSAPFSLQLEGDLTLWSIANTPPVAPSGQARIYYNSSAGKAQISENGGAYRSIGGSDLQLATTVTPQTAFSQSSAAGTGTAAARADHTHGTPLPRHPQSGFPYLDFSGAGVVMGRLSTEFNPAQVGTEDLTTAERMYLVSPMRSSSSGRATVSLIGKTDGNAIVHFYNDLDVNNAVGDTAAAGKPFGIELTGDFTFFTIANTPPVAPTGQAKIYYNSGAQKLQVSQNGGPYVDLVGSGGGVGVGAAGTFLVTNDAGTGNRWTANTEFVVSGGNVGVGLTNPDHKFQVAGGNVKIDGYIWPTLITMRTPRPSLDGALLGVENITSPQPGLAPYERLYVSSPKAAVGWGWSVMDLRGHNDGTSSAVFYNDLDINGAYGNPGTNAASKPFLLSLEGTMEFTSIADTPATKANTARLYYKSSTGKLMFSENNGAYRNIGEPAPGAAGSFLVTNTTGTGTMWAATTEIYFDDVNNRIGIGASAPQERLAVRDGTAGLISTFFGPIGNNSIAVGNDKTTGNALQIGYNDTGEYGYLNVWGASSGGLQIDNDGRVGVGVGATAPGAMFHVSGVSNLYSMQAQGPNVTNSSYGLLVTAGTSLDFSMMVYNAAQTLINFYIRGDGLVGMNNTLTFGAYNGNTTGAATIELHSNGTNKYGFGVHAGPNGQLQSFTTGYFAWRTGGFGGITDRSGELMQLAGDGSIYLKTALYVGSTDGSVNGKSYEEIGTIYTGLRGFGITQLTDTGVHAYRPAAFVATYQNAWVIGPTWHNGAGQPVMEMISYGVNDPGSPRGARVNIYNDQDTNGNYGVVGATKRAMVLNVFGPVHSNGVALTSARELKRGIKDDDQDSLDIVRRFRKRKFKWRYDGDGDGVRTGFVADEIAKAYGDMAVYENGRAIGWKHDEMTVHLVGSVQTLAERNDEYGSEIERLTKENEALKARVGLLEGATA